MEASTRHRWSYRVATVVIGLGLALTQQVPAIATDLSPQQLAGCTPRASLSIGTNVVASASASCYQIGAESMWVNIAVQLKSNGETIRESSGTCTVPSGTSRVCYSGTVGAPRYSPRHYCARALVSYTFNGKLNQAESWACQDT